LRTERPHIHSDDARRRGRQVALALTWLRVVLAVVFLWFGIDRRAGYVAAGLLLVGFLSDVFDGVVARHYAVATAGLRRFDSIADTYFYLAVVFCAWRFRPAVFQTYAVWIAVVLVTEVLHHVLPKIKYGRTTSYHAWSAKTWGAVLFAALALLLARGDGRLLPVAVVCGVIAHLENMAMTLVLPSWHHDVRSIVHAWRLRRETNPSIS